MDEINKPVESGPSKFVRVSMLGFLVLGVWLLIVSGGLLTLGGNLAGMLLLALGLALIVFYKSRAFESISAEFGNSAGYAIWVFASNSILMLLLGYFTIDNLTEPFATYSPSIVEGIVHSGIGFIIAAASQVANIVAYRSSG